MTTGTSYEPFRDSTSNLGHAESLRQALREDGYLFLRGVAPSERLLALRRAILRVLADAGWVDPSADPMAGRWSGAGPFTEGESEYMAVYKHVLHLPEFESFADDPAFVSLASAILDAPAVAHKLRIGRITFPNNVAQTTAAHQDWFYIRGTPETYTIWTPIGDCPIELGGLAVLRGSHAGGFREHAFDPSRKYAGHALREDQLSGAAELTWHTGDFALGDVLMFHSHTIHKALPNRTSDRLRLSTDNRYTRVGAEASAWANKTHYDL